MKISLAWLNEYLDKPVTSGGLALSRFTASAALLVFMVGCIFLFPQRAARNAH